MAKKSNNKAKKAKEVKKEIAEVKEEQEEVVKSNDIRNTSPFWTKVREIIIIHKVACILVFVLILAALVGLVVGVEVKDSKNKEKTHEEKLYEYLEEIGKKWYETDYYDGICQTKKDDCKAYLSSFSDIGIKVDLDNLSRYPDVFEEYQDEFVNDKTDKECDRLETKIIIYPEDDYDKEDYRLETILVCGYDD